ncbi:YciI family protein [Halothece sp. PCC 7418]|uniref:YciI family protein n=1 Tax=Halothece sp. (strain PCC 7418) TaxID=65093 RepID=UPI0002EADD8E|nr:YciI family protein [Halothece sp. PCC 7418]
MKKESNALLAVGASNDAPDEATVRNLVENDPYWQNGIWTEYQVKAWIQAL